ncbi:DUF4291 domain-containing protein [Nocardioides speluncae]|uniref:DUF4291 domain-containing protein n=1 Tax=Nocardioides speluncae TaxID=2670337 RepID=UPI000D691E1E|nr:DUF4291 domain-containing protein [Nocardioides speluncae]
MNENPTPYRQVRADFDDRHLTVYQAYSPHIAGPAEAAGRFVPPFKLDRMTWIKPSFLWMMYRCGWATKPGQERVLAIRLERAGFEALLGEAWLSHVDPGLHASHDDWAAGLQDHDVRIQWDPERDLHHQPLDHRSIQIGLGGSAARRWHDSIVGLKDITDLARRVQRLAAAADVAGATELLPVERPYPVPDHLAAALGMSAHSTEE